MKSGWQIRKLGDICDFDKAQGVYKNLPYVGLEDIESNTARFVGSSDPKKVKSSTFRFSDKHVLYGRLRPYLNKVLAPDFEGHCSTEIFPIKPHSVLSREYLLYWFLAKETVDSINATCTGTRMPRADMNEVLEFDFPLPTLLEQKRIVGILDEAFEGIAVAKANAEKNLHRVSEIAEGLLHAVFDQSWHTWKAQRISEVGEVFDGPHATPKTVESGPIFLGISSLRRGEIDLGETRHVSEKDFKQWTRRVAPQENDVVFSYETRIGEVARIPSGLECCLGRRMALVRVNQSVIDSEFFVLQYRSPQFQEFLRTKTIHGATVDRISIREFPSFPIRVPRLVEQRVIIERSKGLRIQIDELEQNYQQKLTALDELKKSLLHQAFTGKL